MQGIITLCVLVKVKTTVITHQPLTTGLSVIEVCFSLLEQFDALRNGVFCSMQTFRNPGTLPSSAQSFYERVEEVHPLVLGETHITRVIFGWGKLVSWVH